MKDSLGIRVVRVFVRGYQIVVSPIIGPRCRYLPTCSEYFLEAIQTHGMLAGIRMGFARIARCHPWGSHGYDPVPGSDADHLDQTQREVMGSAVKTTHKDVPPR